MNNETAHENRKNELYVPVTEKRYWTLHEAAQCTGIGMAKLREISNSSDCKFVLWVGSRRLLKRDKLIEYLDSAYSI